MQSHHVAQDIARLVRFAADRGLLGPGDELFAENALLDLFQVPEPYDGPLPEKPDSSPVPILERLLDYAVRKGLLPDNTPGYRDLLDARIMGLLLPRPSEVTRTFRQLANEQGIEKATDWFYRLCIDSNYIRMDRVSKNDFWLAPTEYGDLEMTINVSKPEKDPKEIAAQRNLPPSAYPKCQLCPENVGYAGRLNHPARQNLRIIPLELSQSTWFFQYSPYVYYNEHCIVLSERHEPMRINRDTFIRLLEFIEQFPHYFIGSNADLPIVGGSILSHDHFQGGRHVFPMEKAPVEAVYRYRDFPEVRVGRVKWPMSVIRLSASDPNRLVEVADRVLAIWRGYSDPEAEILAHTEQNGQMVPHNTITPIARRTRAGGYELDLVLRNNRTSDEHPLGIFHPHADLHHIKKENIGLIEVMGLAVLPARLQQELAEIEQALASWDGTEGGLAFLDEESHPLHLHADWIKQLAARYGTAFRQADTARQIIRQEVGNVFLRVLSDAGVYKRTEQGLNGFDLFMRTAGFDRLS